MKKLIGLIFLSIFLICSLDVNSQTVYMTKTGAKYHNDGCRYLSKSKIAIELSDAIAKGLSPCSVCKPPTKSSSEVSKGTTQPNIQTKEQPSTQTVTPPSQSTKSVQCKGTTQAGNRCKRMTTNSNGYCYQHQSQAGK